MDGEDRHPGRKASVPAVPFFPIPNPRCGSKSYGSFRDRLMRVRLVTQLPLPPLKAWYLLPSPPTGSSRISELKAELALNLQSFRDSSISGDRLILSIDGFDLLDQSPCDVIKEGDLISIELAPNAVSSLTTHSQKRVLSRNDTGSSAPPKQNRNDSERHVAISPPTPPALGKRKRRLSSSSSDSDTSSTSSSSSSSSASSSSSSAPSVHASHRKDLVSKRKVPANAISFTTISHPNDEPQKKTNGSARPVPPGQGKHRTHERNRRRRELRSARKSQSEGGVAIGSNTSPVPIDPGSGVDFAPTDGQSVGPSAQFVEPTTQFPSGTSAPLHPSAMAPTYSLKNKNKKKGFRQAMEKATPQRVVFGPSKNGNDANEAVSSSLVKDSASTATAKDRPPPVLIPPSQRSDLPSNLFVTSVDVEAGLWGRQSEADDSHAQADSCATEVEAMLVNGTARVTNGEVAKSSAVDIDWDALDSLWSGLPVVSRPVNGMILAWQELGIDPATLSPKMMVSLARVVSHDDTSQTIRVVDLTRPDAEMIGFGYGGFTCDGAVAADDGLEDSGRELLATDMKEWRVFRT